MDGFWENPSHRREYFDWLSSHFQFTTATDWHAVRVEDVDNGILQMHRNSLYEALATVYPEYEWNHQDFVGIVVGPHQQHDSKAQKKLFKIVQSLFYRYQSSYSPTRSNYSSSKPVLLSIIPNYRHPSACYSRSKQPLELDIYIPHLSLALEYQGQQHYHDHFLFGTSQTQRSKVLTMIIFLYQYHSTTI